METSLSAKLCSTCLLSLPLNQFYSKGNRYDTSCKECLKKKKRSTYANKKQEYNVDHLKQAFDMLIDFEIKNVEFVNKQVQEVVERCLRKQKP